MKRSYVGLLDQAVSSLTNFVGVVAAARLLDATELGRFGVTSAVVMATVGLNRTAVAEPLAIRLAAASDEPINASDAGTGSGGVSGRAMLRAGISSTLALSMVVAVALIVPQFFGASLFGSAGWVAAGFLPLILVHDTMRFGYSTLGRQHVVLLSDLVWLASVGVAMVAAAGVTSAGWALVIWLGGLVPAVLVLVFDPLATAPSVSIEFMRNNRDYVVPIVLGYLLVVSAGNLLPLVIGLFGELELAGEYRLLQAVFGPVGVLVQASSLLGLPMLARSVPAGARALARAAAMIGAGLASAAVLWGGALFFMPVSLGERLFGDSWSAVRLAMPYMVVFFLFQMLGFAAILVLKTLNAGRSVLRVRVFVGPGLVAGAVVGLLVARSTEGVLVAMSLVAAAAGVLWYGACREALRGNGTLELDES